VLKRQISVREKAVAALEDYSFDPHRGTWGMSFGGGLGEKLLASTPKGADLLRNIASAGMPPRQAIRAGYSKKTGQGPRPMTS
jgi:hypothetical protein